MKTPTIICILLFGVLVSCGGKYSKQPLTQEDTLRIRRLGLLDTDESIIRYTTNYMKEVDGNFYTDKRIAHFWIDERYADRNSIHYAYYKDIKGIELTSNTTSLTQASYLTIIKTDDSSFRLYISGNNQVVQGFYAEVRNKWQAMKNIHSD